MEYPSYYDLSTKPIRRSPIPTYWQDPDEAPAYYQQLALWRVCEEQREARRRIVSAIASRTRVDALPKSDDWYRQVISLGLQMASSEARVYTVLVDDNFHYMDEDERHTLGRYPTLEAAIDACRDVVNHSLDHLLKPGMTAEKLYEYYRHFGEDPFIAGEPPSTFSAWDYAKKRAAEMIVESPPIAP